MSEDHSNARMFPANDAMRPCYVPFHPEDITIDDAGWLWVDDEWVLVMMREHGEKTYLVFPEHDDHPEDFEWEDANLYKGYPYMPAPKPAIHPGKRDLLEVRISMGHGLSTAIAMGKLKEAAELQMQVMALLLKDEKL